MVSASLVILKGGNVNQRIALEKEKIVLGRNAECDVVINVPAVSREHACILRVQGNYYIEDLGSRNFTYLNNQQLKARQPLKDNDQIKICDFLASFHLPQAAVAPPPLPNPNTQGTGVWEPDGPEEDEAVQESSTVEAKVAHNSSMILEAQSAERLKALLEITSKLARTLELDQLLPKILDRLFELFKQADRGFLIVKDEPSGRLIPRIIKTRRAQDETNARFSRSIVKQCMETVEAFLSDDASADSRFALSQSIADFRIRSVMCAPLWTQDGQAIGVIQLDTQDRSKKFTKDDLNLLMGVASQASVALENARLHESTVARERMKRDMELAKQVQLSFLPRKLPDVDGYDFFAFYKPAQAVGGDYYGFIPLPGNRLVVTVGDVAGKGIPAALLMAKLSSDARFCSLTQSDPACAISELNGLLCETAGSMDRFVTYCAMILDPSSHVVTIVNAGHMNPLIYRHGTGELQEATSNDVVGLPLGISEGFPYESAQVNLEPGDCLINYSDGVSEAMDKANQQFGAERVMAAVKQQGAAMTPRAMGERLMRAVELFAAGREQQHDDITLVCFGRKLP